MKKLFIDEQHMERLEGASIRYHQPVKDKRPVLVPDRPWEADNLNWILGGPIWCRERQRWQLWYTGGKTSDGIVPLYAESADGLTWEKPAIGLVEWQGSKENNIIRLGMEIERGKDKRMMIIRDDFDRDPARRFKGLNRVGSRLYPMASKDGLDWHLIDSPGFLSGDEYRFFQDTLMNRFVATGKVLIERERAITLSISDDFVKWSEPVTIFRSDAKDWELGAKRIDACLADPDRRHPVFVNRKEYFSDFYNMQAFVYEDLYLGLASIFHRSGSWDDKKNQDGIIQPVLASSRDLRDWNRLSYEIFMPLSPLSASDVCDQAIMMGMPPVRHGDELWFYYRGGRYSHMGMERVAKMSDPGEHKAAIQVARLRLDGFASVRAEEKPGTVVTKPLKIDGRLLFVNANARAGELRAGIVDSETGNAIPGFAMEESMPIRSDGVDIQTRWKDLNDVASLRGKIVRLVFTARNADLYAFWFQ